MNLFLERLAEHVIPFPYASEGRVDGLFAHARKVDKNTAIKMPLVQINGPRCIRYLVFDIDRKYGALAWEDANLPIPNLILTNPDNRHAHLVYELETPVWLRRKDDPRPGEAKPVLYLKAVYKAMAKALRADPRYVGLLCKNPFHPSWTLTVGRQKPFTLGDLSAHLELLGPYEAKEVYNPEGRNCTLFDSIRFWAYREKSQFDTFDLFRDSLHDELHRLNDALPYPLPWQELKHIGKSVSSWVWNTYDGTGRAKRRGVMQLDPTEDLRIRQQKGQAYTCIRRVEKTVRIIGSAIREISVAGLRVTIAEVQRRTTLSRNTIQGYWSRFTDTLTSLETEEPVSLRDRSSCSLRSQGGFAPTERYSEPTQLNNTKTYSFAEVKSMTNNIARACKYALEQGRNGIMIEGVPATFKQTVLRAIDKWRLQEFSMHDQPTTQ